MGLCASANINKSNNDGEEDDTNVPNPSHNSGSSSSNKSNGRTGRKSFGRMDTVTCRPSDLRPASKPHNEKFPMITEILIDSIDDYYTPSGGKNDVLNCSVAQAPPKAILGKGQFGTVVRCKNKQVSCLGCCSVKEGGILLFC